MPNRALGCLDGETVAMLRALGHGMPARTLCGLGRLGKTAYKTSMWPSLRM
jgi:hypothetical protein